MPTDPDRSMSKADHVFDRGWLLQSSPYLHHDWMIYYRVTALRLQTLFHNELIDPLYYYYHAFQYHNPCGGRMVPFHTVW
jgi:hypothetical protein